MNRVLDELTNPRHLAIGSRPAVRQLRDGVPDVAVITGALDRELEAVELGRWEREWGLLVPTGNPDGVAGVSDLLNRDLRVANRSRDSGLRRAFEGVLANIADERGTSRPELEAGIAGFEVGLRAHESPARRVLAGAADVGVGLGETADRLGLGFVSLGRQSVRVLGNPDRLETAGVRELTEFLE